MEPEGLMEELLSVRSGQRWQMTADTQRRVRFHLRCGSTEEVISPFLCQRAMM